MKSNAVGPVGLSPVSRCFSRRRWTSHPSPRMAVLAFLRGSALTTVSKKPQAKELDDVRLQLDIRTLLESREGVRPSNDPQNLTRSLKDPRQPIHFSSATLSAPVLRARQKVLDIVMASLGRSGKFGSMDMVELVLQGRGAADFAAALSLLLECGQQELQVVAAGTAFLAESRSKPAPISMLNKEALPDVAVCVAIAHHQLATSFLGGTSGIQGSSKGLVSSNIDVLGEKPLEEAYGHAISGLKVTKDWLGGSVGDVVGPASSSSLLNTARLHLLDLLMVITPRLSLSLLSTGSKPLRSRATEILRHALWQELCQAEQRMELMSHVRSSLSAAEQISLYENIQVPDAELAEQELYDSALAHIWEGYTQRWPHHIFRAYMLLGMISERPNLGLDVRLERNVCALLLGKEQDEGLGKRMTYGAEEPAKMDNPQIHDSSLGESTEALGNESAIEVMHTADAREQQSATEEWAQRWLELSIMPSFISQTDSPTLDGKDGSVRKQQSMHEYLSSPKVVVFNQVLRHANEQNLRSVTENLQHMSHEALQQLLLLWKSSASTLANAQQSIMHLGGGSSRSDPSNKDDSTGQSPGASVGIGKKDDASSVSGSSGDDSRSVLGGETAPSSSSEEEEAPGQYEAMIAAPPEEYTEDCMASLPPPAMAAADLQPPSSASATSTEDAIDIPTLASGGVSSLLTSSGPWGWTGVTARLVDPTVSKSHAADAGSPHNPLVDPGRGSGVALSTQFLVFAALAGATWLSGRGALPRGVDLAPGALTQLRSLEQRAAMILKRDRSASVSRFPSTKVAIVEMVASSEVRGIVLTPSTAARLLLSWQAVEHSPLSYRGSLLPLVLEGRALGVARSKLSAALKKKRPVEPIKAPSEGGMACRVEVVSCELQTPRKASESHGVIAAVVRARITIKSVALERETVEEVLVGLQRSVGKEEGSAWRVTHVDGVETL